MQSLPGNGTYPARLPQLHPDLEEPARLVRGRVPRLVGQVGLAVNSVTAPRLLRRAQLRRPFDNRRTIDHRYRRGEHRVRVGRVGTGDIYINEIEYRFRVSSSSNQIPHREQ